MGRYLEVNTAKLRRLRREQALSQQELADLSGTTQETISRLERGHNAARGHTIRKLAEALGVKPRELIKEAEKPFEVGFSNGSSSSAIRVHDPAELPVALRELGLDRSHPVLVVVGGAGEVSEADMVRLRSLFVEVLAPLVEALGASVVDGGTDAGVMRLMGRSRSETRATFPLIGVVATGTVTLPGAPPPRPDAAPLEPNHTHFVLVPGSEWGDDSPWLPRVASVLAKGAPSATVVVNGGEHTWTDVSQSVKAGRPVIAVAGSGRAADALASALRSEAADERAKDLAASGLVQAVDMTADPDALTRIIEDGWVQPVSATVSASVSTGVR
ncbi:MAG: helix-turn-helix domain-containing protein [Rubrobacter sp.]|nr:helix-turn-helix domain-containing protein [Rubrobacter sp.]